MTAKIELQIDRIGDMTRIINASGYEVWFSYVPSKPKRKMHDFLVIPDGQFLIDEDYLDLERIVISFRKRKDEDS